MRPARLGRTTSATCARSDTCGDGDVDAVLQDCDEVVDHVYHTKACQQAMMETFRTYTEIDPYGRLRIVSSTQIVFHVRRIIANALDIPKSRIHVVKPRIGGGFGAKQTVVAESLSRARDMEDRQARQDSRALRHPRGMPDRGLAAA